MEKQCRNCGETVFEHDATCWHCGEPVTPSPTAIPRRRAPDERDLAPLSPSRVLVYAGLLTVTFIALWAAMTALGQLPSVAVEVVGETERWLNITDREHGFAVAVPDAWENSFAAEINPAAEQQSITALRPWSDLVDDLAPLMVSAATEGSGAELIIARSAKLVRLTPQQAVAALEAESFPGIERRASSLIANVAGQEQAALHWLQQDDTIGELHCLQRFAVSDAYGYVATACAPAPDFDSVEKTLTDALRTFSLVET